MIADDLSHDAAEATNRKPAKTYGEEDAACYPIAARLRSRVAGRPMTPELRVDLPSASTETAISVAVEHYWLGIVDPHHPPQSVNNRREATAP